MKMNYKIWKKGFFLIFLLLSIGVKSREYVIYNISQDIPMGFENEIIKKNFYVNLGQDQGIKNGDILNVYRMISRLDPYASKKRYNHKVKIGELKIVHSENNSSISEFSSLTPKEKTPYLEIGKFMVGDRVGVRIK